MFYIRPNLSMSAIEDELRKRECHDESATRFLLIDLNDIYFEAQVWDRDILERWREEHGPTWISSSSTS